MLSASLTPTPTPTPRGRSLGVLLLTVLASCEPVRLESDPHPADANTDPEQNQPMCLPPRVSESAWLGCSKGCVACADILQPYDLYFANHPDCRRGDVCGIVGQTCGAACPMPTVADTSCGPLPGNWMGCRGTGCTVDTSLIGTFAPTYFQNHPWCKAAMSSDPLVPCSATCPSPTPADMMVCDGTPGEWKGCRGYGCWVCAELLKNYPLYLKNHPACTANVTCHSRYFTCSSACPAPGPADQ